MYKDEPGEIPLFLPRIKLDLLNVRAEWKRLFGIARKK